MKRYGQCAIVLSLALSLGACSSLTQQAGENPAPAEEAGASAAKTKQAAKTDGTPEAAATEAMATEGAAAIQDDGSDIPAPLPGPRHSGAGDDVDYTPDYVPETAGAYGLKNGGLRMGNFAPPEEATGNSETPALRPNAVQLRGLRSPSLKGGALPMDINGKLTEEKR